MMMLDIEQPEDLLQYLRESGRLERGEAPVITPLKGGVSNRTVLVERSDGTAFVVKQALEKLRVSADWHSDPNRSHREALGLRWLARLAPERTITPLLFEDTEHHLLAMQAIPRPHENWKSRLLAGGLEMARVKQFGELLGTIHRRARERQTEVAAVFEDRSYFESLRLEPYYRYTAAQHPEAANFFAELMVETNAVRETLVHGDYSPKNILVYQDTLVLLDHEVIHFGDPAFDLGFSLTHFLSKAHHVAALRERFLEAAQLYWNTYEQTATELASATGLQRRVVRHTLACLLARVDGRSPLEYLTRAQCDQQRKAVLGMMKSPPATTLELIQRFREELRSPMLVHASDAYVHHRKT